MAKRKLPRGLAEFEASIFYADHSRELLERLLDLPDNDLADDIAEHDKMLYEADELSQKASSIKYSAGELAENIFRKCVKKYTIKQLQEATGYDDE